MRGSTRTSLRALFAATLVAAPVLARPVRASQTAIDIDTSKIWVVFGGSTHSSGWQFSTTSDVEVTALGLWDGAQIDGQIGDGLLFSHPIAIWDISNHLTPLVSTIIPSGTEAQLGNDGFRYVEVSSTLLPAGRTYAIAAKYSDATSADHDNRVEGNNNALSLQVGPGIEFGGYRYGGGPSELAFPDNYHPETLGMFGPNFTYEQVPESTTLTFLGIGLLVLVVATGGEARTWLR